MPVTDGMQSAGGSRRAGAGWEGAERRSIIFTTNIEFSKWGTVFADDKLAAAIIDRIVHHGRLLEFTGQSRRVSEALMFGRNTSAQPEK